jgi:ABC-type antimicrobial peptide transport system permease subunit
VIVINETAARRYWRGRNPIGGRVRFGQESVEVVGVGVDLGGRTLNEAPRPCIYFPLYQAYRPGVTLVVRSDADAKGIMASIEKGIRSLDPRVPVFDVQTLEEHLQLSVFIVRMAAVLLGLFGVMALLLATTGLYGVLAHAVSQRTHEIGVRMALGADRWRIVRFVIRQGLVVTGTGLGLGVLVAAAVTRLVASQLIGVGPLDPLSYLGPLAVLTAVALVACYLPARRAARQDPLRSLRWE